MKYNIKTNKAIYKVDNEDIHIVSNNNGDIQYLEIVGYKIGNRDKRGYKIPWYKVDEIEEDEVID